MEMYSIKLENGEDWIIIDTVEYQDNKYLILGNETSNDINVRKVVINNNEEYITKLDSREEFEMVMTLFKEKNKGDNDE